MISLSASGTLTVTESRERDLIGGASQTVDTEKQLDTSGSFEDTISLNTFFSMLGIFFISTDNTISFNHDGSVDAYEFIEGNRVYIDNAARLTVVSLKETI